MNEYKVDDLMVPLSEYATVTIGATLHEAMMALDQHAALKALEPQYLKMATSSSAASYGFSVPFLKDLQEQYSLLDGALENICHKAAKMKVEDFMSTLTEGEFIDLGISLDQAIHMLVMGHHQSLLVKKAEKVVGVLRLTDVFAAVFHVMKTCEM
ncbi:MAG: hypothetical protein HGJ93_19130 [Desulfosarcina sp.]|nr:hypothetical protein [Desulfosarcina sp.]MBC2767979.1 hypothetical protein [Desulfosarcina sp.]